MDVKILAPGLVYIENIISNPSLLINKIENLCSKSESAPTERTVAYNWDYWKDGQQTFCNQIFLPIKEQLSEYDINYNDIYEIVDCCETILDNALSEYYKIYKLAKDNIKRKERTISILKYSAGGYLPLHQDLGISTRVLSTVIYLNDDYEGGNINFPEVNVTIKPKSGSILLFPSNFVYAHEVQKIINGTRYCLPNFHHNTINIVDSDGTA